MGKKGGGREREGGGQQGMKGIERKQPECKENRSKAVESGRATKLTKQQSETQADASLRCRRRRCRRQVYVCLHNSSFNRVEEQ